MLSLGASPNRFNQPSGRTAALPALSAVDRYLQRSEFREGLENTPSGPVTSLVVSSWWQVPQVLAKLQKPDQRFVIRFSSKVAPLEIKEIRKFLQGAHNKGSNQIRAELKARLEGSARPAALKDCGFTGNADEWMTLNGIKTEAKVKYAVTDILTVSSAWSRPGEDLVDRLDKAFETVNATGRSLVLALERREDKGMLGMGIQGVIDSVLCRNLHLLPISVRMPKKSSGTAAAKLTATPCAGPELEEWSLVDFYRYLENGGRNPDAPDGSGQHHAGGSTDVNDSLTIQGAPDVAVAPAISGQPDLPDASVAPVQGAGESSVGTLTQGGAASSVSGQAPGAGPDVMQAGAQANKTSDPNASAPNKGDSKRLPGHGEDKGDGSRPEARPTPSVPAKQESLAVEHRKVICNELSNKLHSMGNGRLDGLSEKLDSFYASRALPDITWPGEESRLIKVSDTKFARHEIKKGEAAAILEVCRNRTFADTARMLFGAEEKLIEELRPRQESGLSNQSGFLVKLPSEGTAIFFSDLEGDVTKLAMLMDEYKLVERWKNKEKIFLCVLGDSVDRSPTGSLLIDFLLELKFNQGFEKQVIILPGNHEIDATQNFKDLEWWQDQDPALVGDIFAREFKQPGPNDGATRDIADRATINQLVELCPKIFPSLHANPKSLDEISYRARGGLYTLYHSIFNLLPRYIVSERGLYAAHAGFPTHGAFEKFLHKEKVNYSGPQMVYELSWPRFDELNSKTWLDYLLWADFHPEHFANEGFVPLNDPRRTDPRTGRTIVNLDDFKRFADPIGATLMVRGHQDYAPKGATRPEEWTKLAKQLQEGGCEPLSGGPWIAGPIATVHKAHWAAVLDLAIDKPSPADLTWIGAIPYLAHANILLRLPPLNGSSERASHKS